MLEPGGEADLALEPLGAERGGELGEQDLERDRAVVPEVLGQVDHGHAAAPELALEGVAVGEGVAQAIRHAHRGSRDERTTWYDAGDEAIPAHPIYRETTEFPAPRHAPHLWLRPQQTRHPTR